MLTSALPDFDSMVVGDRGQVLVPPGYEDNLLAAGLVVQVLTILTTLLALGACLKAAGDAYLGRTPEVGDSLRFARGRLGPMLWLGFLFVVAVFLGTLALIIPGIYLAVAFSVAVPVLLVEDLRGTKALGRSRRLVSGRWWSTLGVLVLGYMLLPLVFGLVLGLAVAAVTAGMDSVMGQLLIQLLMNLVISLLVTPFTVTLLAILYFDLRVRKEAFDLQLLAERIDPGPSAAPAAPSPGV